ncbi:MAG: hypothetical protein COV26_01000 [Candidatus Nealsonbacteria bacterium CG10_big_fil_rev_8_21_14_0_10_36_23]|uniref:Uncharacterized protein n=1 Tax=Candidatus Nealsonbacteria bacterium CG10_big_fil_rev_8_21_14_0_10_36_23 TaxID=1974709 RepID=A0A2H0TLE0_9BACT|nr:MAG: hypothetical protein COV26_01000 [Candidatus Nealsonbacteria bacterium CG10_big_fil_rev_8_21_14_0_10_36_23]
MANERAGWQKAKKWYAESGEWGGGLPSGWTSINTTTLIFFLLPAHERYNGWLLLCLYALFILPGRRRCSSP